MPDPIIPRNVDLLLPELLVSLAYSFIQFVSTWGMVGYGQMFWAPVCKCKSFGLQMQK